MSAHKYLHTPSPEKFVPNRILVNIGLSSTAAIVAEIMTYPLDLTKSRLQIQGEKGVGKGKGMLDIGWGVVKNEGFLKLWRGIFPSAFRHVFYTGGRISIYEYLREGAVKKNKHGTVSIYKLAGSSMFAAVCGQFMANPTDLVKVRLQMDGEKMARGLPVRQKGTIDALTNIFREDGLRGLWRGAVPNCQRAILLSLGDVLVYHKTKTALQNKFSRSDGVVTHLLASGIAGLTSTLVCTPIDVIKTRIMNQPTRNGKGIFYRSPLHCLLTSIKEEGPLVLYKGFIPIYIRLGPWIITFWVLFEKLRDLYGIETF